MRIQRLSWAGIKLEAGATTIFVDAIATAGDWGLPAVPLAVATPRCHALVTHAHPDHDDPVALRAVLGDGGAVLCHRAIAGELARRDLATRGVALHEPVLLDWLSTDLAVTAVPAADGWGLRQVSWVVDGGGRRIIRCGDTLWHGHWWDIARRYGPFDLAFLPINGVVYHRGRYTGSPIPATLTPEQAAVAGQLLGARAVCPIHYGRADDPAHYAEVPDAEAAFLAEARRRGVGTLVLAAGAWVEWGGVAGAGA